MEGVAYVLREIFLGDSNTRVYYVVAVLLFLNKGNKKIIFCFLHLSQRLAFEPLHHMFDLRQSAPQMR